MAAAWVCAVCGRRVPGYVQTCHCGAGRTAVPAASPLPRAQPRPGVDGRRIDPRDITWQVWLALGFMTLLLIGGIVSLFLPFEPERVVPLLGHADRVPEPPASSSLPAQSRP